MIFICLASTVTGLFEDKAGKFDWRQSYVGKVRQQGQPGGGRDWGQV